jgi:hypothetical protein
MHSCAVAALLAAVLLALGLFGPKRSDETCVAAARLGLGATLSLNCDSRHITRDARELERYLATPSPSRTRPVHILAVSVATVVLSPVLVPAAALVAGTVPQVPRRDLASYLAAIAVNGLIVALAAMALVKIAGAEGVPLLAVLLAGLVASYDVTAAWFWVPHQIVMNTLVPVGGVLAYMLGRGSAHLPVRHVALLGLATAVGCLTYGYCLIWPVAFELGLVAGWLAASPRMTARNLAHATVYAGAVCLPMIAWFGAYAALGGQVAYEAQAVGQFQWAAAALRDGTLVSEGLHRLAVLAHVTAGYFGMAGLALAAIVGALLVVLARQGRLPAAQRDAGLQGAVVVLIVMLAFNYLQGYHAGRLLLFPRMLLVIALLRLMPPAGLAGRRPAVVGAVVAAQTTAMLLWPPVSME